MNSYDKQKNRGEESKPKTKFDEILAKVNDLVSCNPECQKARKAAELKNNYLKTINDYDNKPSKPQDTFKKSTVSNERLSGYDNIVDTDLESNSYIISQMFNEQFKNNVSIVTVNVDSYENLLTNYRNVADFYETILKENSILKKDIMITSGGILTNNRKSYYENQIVENLHYWYGWIRFFYILMIAGFIVGICLLPYEEPRFKYVAVLVLLAIYPFIINPIVNWLREMYQRIAGNYFSKDSMKFNEIQ